LDRERLLNWLNQVYSTREAEVDCDRLQALLPTLVELETGGEAVLDNEGLTQVRAHLAQCPDCAEEYESLCAIVRLDNQGELPEVDESLENLEAPTTFEHV
jgi:hypothetical protein